MITFCRKTGFWLGKIVVVLALNAKSCNIKESVRRLRKEGWAVSARKAEATKVDASYY